jgi:hypothetical protein
MADNLFVRKVTVIVTSTPFVPCATAIVASTLLCRWNEIGGVAVSREKGVWIFLSCTSYFEALY